MTPNEVRLIRVRLVVLAAVLVSLWSYAAYVASQDAADLLRVRALADTLGQPVDRLVLGLQAERRLTAEGVAAATPTAPPLVAARAGTDRAAAEVRAFTEGRDLRLLSAGDVRDRAGELVRRLDGLGTIRSQVDAGRLDLVGAIDAYDQVVDVAFRVYGPEWGAYESTLAADTRAVIALARARELLAREDTLVSAALTGARLGTEARSRLTELVSSQRYARGEAAAGLPDGGQSEHQRLLTGPDFAGLLALEARLLAADTALTGITVQAWRAAADAALGALQTLVTTTARSSAERAAPGAAVVVARTGAVVGLGLIVVLVLLLGWVSTVRRLTDERVTPDDGTPAQAVTPAQAPARDATTTPDGDAEQELFLLLTRRNQVLLRDQLGLLDGMQRRERSAEETSELFQLDHLTTRIRRNVEKLITLAGTRPARRWRRPVPLLDVARGAVAEVPDYHRVLIAPHWPWSLAGPAVTDVVHLLSELIENALAFSAADTTVRVSAEYRPQGCAVLVVDDGPGMDSSALAEANHLLGHPPPDGPPTGFAGLYAAAVLAGRSGAHVSLRPSRRGGTAATVLLPGALVTSGDTGRGPAGASPGTPHPPARGGTDPSAQNGDGQLPTRIRHTGPTGPKPGRTSLDTVELPVARATRRHP
ncbi:nitrate- and nitrite sensing domain-containing protein [Micromonospora sp. LAH09]|uniref:sensor histidine kinase n=1 Tax=Micromonospora cabrerizensis TaxID=2911213 RepID=UPI001EE7D7CC|nr:nitrate- and nitrite sensing domain-containing protein [Micromonospora cabrerizensis]MCG5471793.1 nitrate- and nitrite sensing domain-containing protein [Micromonospora cabrerizensis]